MTAPDLYDTAFRLAYLAVREEMESIDFELVFDITHYLEDHRALWFRDELEEEKATSLIERFRSPSDLIEATATPNQQLLQILRDLRH